jgi:hypothetical protein
MVLAFLPLAASAIGGFALLEAGVMRPLNDIAVRQRQQIAPVQALRVLIWDGLAPVDEFVDEGGGHRPGLYRALRVQVETKFASLHQKLASEPGTVTLLKRARDD